MATEIEIELTLAEREIIKQLGDVNKGIDKLARDGERSFNRVDAAFASFAGNLAAGAVSKGVDLIVSGFSNLVSVGQEFVALANVQEDAINRLNTQLALTGDFSEQTSKEFQEFASQLQSVTTFGDEAILNQLALAKSFGATNEQAKQIATAATDLAASFGIDLESATRNVAKTLGGFAGELGESIPALKALTQEQLQAGAGVELLSQRFEGAAQAAAQTFSGALQQAQNALGDTQESFGSLITENQLVIASLNGFQKAFQFVSKFVEENRESFNRFISFLVGTFIDGLELAGNATLSLVGAFSAVKDGIAGAEILVNNFIAATVDGFASIIESGAAVKEFFGGTADDFRATAQEYRDLAKGFELVNLEIANQATERQQAEQEFANTFRAIKDGALEVIRQEVEAVEGAEARKKNAIVETINAKTLASQQEAELANQGFENEAILEEARQARKDEIAQQELLRKELQSNEEFQILEKGLGREEALKQVALANELKRNNKEAQAKQQLANQLALAERKITEDKKRQEQIREQNLRSTLGTISTLTQSSNKELFAIGKAAALSIAITDGISAVQKALASAPPPFNFALAAAVGAATAANVTRIASQRPPSFQDGGIVPGTSFTGDNVVARVNSGEMVLNRAQQASLFRQINGGTSGDSGLSSEIALLREDLANQPVVVQVDGEEIARAVRNSVEQGFQLA